MFQKTAGLKTELQRLDEINELFRSYGHNLQNMDPIQLNILELEVSDCLKKIKGNKK
ncbi:MAG: hypothetical protein KJ561_01475 [Nanoarchaeota archaeon]|nr:hypothetical protein [Nanoarchaeota archaeon]